jgi:cardiolipin synthase
VLRQLPNLITLMRIVLVLPVGVSVIREQYQQAFWLFALAGFSDGVDGLLARLFDWRSRFGAIADPVADKLLLVTTFVAGAVSGVWPWWLMAVVLIRDLVIFSGSVAYHLLVGPYQMAPTWLGKLCTFSQIGVVLLLLQGRFWLPLPPWSQSLMVAFVALVSIVSGLHYVLVWSRKYREQRFGK